MVYDEQTDREIWELKYVDVKCEGAKKGEWE